MSFEASCLRAPGVPAWMTAVWLAGACSGVAVAQDCPTAAAGKAGFVVERGDSQKTEVFHVDDGIVRTVMRFGGETLLETTQNRGLFQLDRIEQGVRTTYEFSTGLRPTPLDETVSFATGGP